VKGLVDRALNGQKLTPEQWRLLAFYSWETDHQQLVKDAELAQRLKDLAAAVPPSLPLERDRLAFKAVYVRAEADGKRPDAATLDGDRKVVDRVLTAESGHEELSDLVFYYAEPVIKYLSPETKGRTALARAWEQALVRMSRQQELSSAARIDVLDTRVSLWKLQEGETLSTSRREQVRQEVGQIIARTTDRYERQAVVPSAGHVLTSAGLVDESDKLLKAELRRAVAPYYHMLVLADNAKKRGDSAGALQWYEQAWRKSEGRATRLQWGSNYVGKLVELTPGDVMRVSSAASAVISGLEAKNETFFERNERSLQKMAKKLTTWQGSDSERMRAVAKLKEQLARTCTKLPAKQTGRANCEHVFAKGRTES
jgi:hypothetical protein